MEKLKYHDILYNNDQLGPYPDHLLKRVDKPTNRVPGPIDRVSERDSPFIRSFFGEFGEEIKREFKLMSARYPIWGSMMDIQWHINKYKASANPVAAKKAPHSRRSTGHESPPQVTRLLPRRRRDGHRPPSPVGRIQHECSRKSRRSALQVRHRLRGPQERTDAGRLQRLGRHRRRR